MKNYCLYKIVILETGQFYIGVSQNVEERIKQHKKGNVFCGKEVDVAVLCRSNDKMTISQKESELLYSERRNPKLLNRQITSTYHAGTSIELYKINKLLEARKRKMKSKWEKQNSKMYSGVL